MADESATLEADEKIVGHVLFERDDVQKAFDEVSGSGKRRYVICALLAVLAMQLPFTMQSASRDVRAILVQGLVVLPVAFSFFFLARKHPR
jgi:hypothetical protein